MSIMVQSATRCDLAIVIVTYNSASVLPALLDSLPAGLAGIEYHEIIVVDNDSADYSVNIAGSHGIRPRIIKMGRNAGYAAAINAAAATVNSQAHLLILNPDVRLHPGAAYTLVDRLSDASVGVAAPRLIHENGKLVWSLRREPSLLTAWTDAILGGTIAARIGTGEMIGRSELYEREGVIEWATGAVLAVAAHARRVVGNWDESFFLYMEEVDYLRRVREQGFSVVYVPRASAVHVGGDYRDPRLSALLTANRIRYHRRHHGRLSTALLRLAIIAGEGMRAVRGPSHRANMWAALTPSTCWARRTKPVGLLEPRLDFNL
jgi:N-acetylglucosaminyl-diphospho-decaprenol L-rhamnosyltransferase